MAEQEEMMSFSGSLGNTTGYKRGKKYFKRKKTGSYQPPVESLKSAGEFGKASKASALLRKAFKAYFLLPFIPDLHSRLSKVCAEVIRSGPIALKGKRQLFEGDLDLLKKFEFNIHRKFDSLSDLSIDVIINQDLITISVLPFTIDYHDSLINSRAKIMIGFAWFNFAAQTFKVINSNPIYLPVEETFGGGKVKLTLPKNEDCTLIIMGNICFENIISLNGNYGTIGNRRFKAGKILHAMHFIKGTPHLFEAPTDKKITEIKKDEDIDVYWE
jgi:hypothetical protein